MEHVLHGICCKGSMGQVARAPWYMLRGLHGTFYDSKLVTRLYSVPRIFLVQWLKVNIETPEEIMIYVGLSAMLHGTYCTNPWDMLRGLHGPCWAPLDML